ncbi:MAG: formate-dependent phosphoribosylglycinamide formyltransferase [Gammaproteobacteria bacterium]|nr:formate-dependent phosphoribosylglycinamide formyltransferase [Gammaproteobacteria bacterium]MCF6258940.1 formate-dependent phosphoribosylglycinamide formyltransferase [Gammaproteobacteria bacterium]
MKIGTPLSDTALRVMLLGSGELGKEVIIALQRLGVEVIAVDRYDNAPGQQVAHRAHTIDMTDSAALRALIEQEKPHFIVPEIEAIATDMLAEIEADGLTQVIPTARATQLTMNREGIRRLAAEELNIATSRYAFADSHDELQTAIDNGVGYPCIVKPVMSSSGKGQSTLHSPDDIAAAWDHAINSGRVSQTRVIVEEMVRFDFEITQLTVRALNAQGEIQTYFCDPIGHLQQQGDYVESWQPQIMSEIALARSRQIAKEVTDNLGGRGLFGVELFIKGDEVWFSEVSPRPHDTGMVTMVTQAQNEFELHARAILGLPVDTRLREPGASAVIYGGHEQAGIAFEGIAEALRVQQTELRLFGKPEAFVRRRMGVALAYGGGGTHNSANDARQRAKQAASLIKPVPK